MWRQLEWGQLAAGCLPLLLAGWPPSAGSLAATFEPHSVRRGPLNFCPMFARGACRDCHYITKTPQELRVRMCQVSLCIMPRCASCIALQFSGSMSAACLHRMMCSMHHSRRACGTPPRCPAFTKHTFPPNLPAAGAAARRLSPDRVSEHSAAGGWLGPTADKP